MNAQNVFMNAHFVLDKCTKCIYECTFCTG